MELTISLTHLHVERDKTWQETAKLYLQHKERRAYYEQQEKELLEKLKQLSDGVASKGGGYVFTPSYRKGAVDYTAIPELRGIDLERYRKPGVDVWKLTYEIVTGTSE